MVAPLGAAAMVERSVPAEPSSRALVTVRVLGTVRASRYFELEADPPAVLAASRGRACALGAQTGEKKLEERHRCSPFAKPGGGRQLLTWAWITLRIVLKSS